MVNAVLLVETLRVLLFKRQQMQWKLVAQLYFKYIQIIFESFNPQIQQRVRIDFAYVILF